MASGWLKVMSYETRMFNCVLAFRKVLGEVIFINLLWNSVDFWKELYRESKWISQHLPAGVCITSTSAATEGSSLIIHAMAQPDRAFLLLQYHRVLGASALWRGPAFLLTWPFNRALIVPLTAARKQEEGFWNPSVSPGLSPRLKGNFRETATPRPWLWGTLPSLIFATCKRQLQ